MPTEDDLREVLQYLDRTTPAPDGLLAKLDARRSTRRRRSALVVGVVLATAAAAVAGPLAATQLGTRTDPAGQEKRNNAWTRWVDVPVPKGMWIHPEVYSANRQDYELRGFTGSPWYTQCLLTVHRNGDFDPATIPAGSPQVDLNGREGRIVTAPWSRPFIPTPTGYIAPLFTDPLKTVVWQPANGLWALITCASQLELGTRKVPKIDARYRANLNLATAIAKSTSPGTRTLGSPVKIGYLPTGLVPDRATYRRQEAGIPGSGEEFNILFSDGNPKTGHQPREALKGLDTPDSAYSPRQGQDLQVTYTTDKFWNQMTRFEKVASNPPDLTIHGMKTWYISTAIGGQEFRLGAAKTTKAAIRMEGNGVAVVVDSLDAKADLDELRKIAQNLQITKYPNDPSSWFDAATAIP
ncbi:hypothetical protein [Kribbella swartbergensis]